MKGDLRYVLLSAVAALSGAPTVALAQAAHTPGEHATAIEEVVVTATRRETALQSTPLAVTAVSGEQIQEAGVTSVRDLSKVAPTIQFSETNFIPQIFIRGIGLQQVSIGGEAGVATHLDGVYLGRSAGIAAAIYDLERVEVLRGPQGTLYGRNATGGSINFITAGPTSSTEAYAILTAGNYDQVRLETAASGPLVRGVEGRLALLYDRREGYTENLVTGKPIGHPEKFATRLTLKVAPEGSNFDVRMSADYLRGRDDPPVFKRRDVYGEIPRIYVPIAGGRYTDEPWKVYSQFEGQRGDLDLSGLNVTATWDLGWATLKSITGARRMILHRTGDIDATDLSIFEQPPGRGKANQFSQEVQLLSSSKGPLEWVLGAYYFDETASDQSSFRIQLNFASQAKPFLVPFNLDLASRQYTRAAAVFAQASYSITHQLRATVGLRYADDSKKIHEFQRNQFPTLPALTQTLTADLAAGWNAWTPKFGIEYHLGDGTLLYASATNGFKAGGFNSASPSQTFPYDPEEIWTYEVGLKRDWLEGRLRTNLAVFRSNYSDLQVTQYINSVIVITNAAKAKIDGAELEVTYRPAEGLTLHGSLAYLDTAYERTNPPFTLRDGVTQQFFQMTGKSLPYAPEFAFNLALQYRRPVPSLGGDLQFDASYDWRDDVHFDPLDFPTETQKAYGLADVRLAYERADGKLEFAAFGRNLFNKFYYANLLRAAATINGSVGNQGTPRTYGVELKFRY